MSKAPVREVVGGVDTHNDTHVVAVIRRGPAHRRRRDPFVWCRADARPSRLRD